MFEKENVHKYKEYTRVPTFIDIFAASLNCQYFQKTKSNFKQND